MLKQFIRTLKYKCSKILPAGLYKMETVRDIFTKRCG